MVKHERLIHSIIKRFPLSSLVSYDDLFQEGLIGHLMAERTFDSSKGFKESTYFHRCIHNRIMGFIERNGGLINLPASTVRRHRGRDTSLSRVVEYVQGVNKSIIREGDDVSDTGIPFILDNIVKREEGGLDRLLKRELINRAFKGVSFTNKKIMVGVIRQGRTRTELAKRLGVRTNTICGRIARVSKKVRENLEGYA